MSPANRRMSLAKLLGDPTLPPVEVTGLALDSRAVQPGYAFFALRGATAHGMAFAQRAIDAGASVVLFEPPHDVPESPVPFVAIANLRGRLGDLANRFFDSPTEGMTVVGVTGTNGKTSTVQLLAQALSGAGHVVGTIGTLGAGLHGQLVEGERTTPDVLGVHTTIAALADAGATHLAMEVSSHALDQGRVDGLKFDVAVFTNLTRDHLDYHGTFDAYGAAKAKLFAWPSLNTAVVNVDDAFGRKLAASLPSPPAPLPQAGEGRSAVSSQASVAGTSRPLARDAGEGQLALPIEDASHARLRSAGEGRQVRRLAYSANGERNAELRATDIELSLAGLSFTLHAPNGSIDVRSSLIGRFNVSNLLAVAGCLIALGWSLESIRDAIATLQPVNGRMNRLGGDGTAPLVVIDYAHTPDALEQALDSLRGHVRAKLICVFGCGGDRDRGKRPQMAAIAEAKADVVIVTDDNPRTENGDAIVAEIVAGLANANAATIERDRRRAIGHALKLATNDDVVLIAGKGHETYQEVNGVKHPFDDLAVAREWLERAA